MLLSDDSPTTVVIATLLLLVTTFTLMAVMICVVYHKSKLDSSTVGMSAPERMTVRQSSHRYSNPNLRQLQRSMHELHASSNNFTDLGRPRTGQQVDGCVGDPHSSLEQGKREEMNPPNYQTLSMEYRDTLEDFMLDWQEMNPGFI